MMSREASASTTGAAATGSGDLPLGARVLVTGCAGFIGSHLSERLVDAGHPVVGIDCFTSFYSRAVKRRNVDRLLDESGFELLPLDLSRDDLTSALEGVDVVFHLAAQAGVRGSFGESFTTYLSHNVRGTQRLLEATRETSVSTLVYASSSSVYGDASEYPTTEETPRRPVSPYGMTKAATEDIAGVYHRTFGIPVIGLRYFTAYGPRQRPDMAFARFLTRALAGAPLPVIGDGTQIRDFTFVDDIVEGTIAAACHGRPGAVYNIGGGHPVQLREALALMEDVIGRPIELEFRPSQRGEAQQTGCDGACALEELGYAPTTRLEDGLRAQFEWIEPVSRRVPLTA